MSTIKKTTLFILSVIFLLIVTLTLSYYIEKYLHRHQTVSDDGLRKVCPYTFASWNLNNFGKSKSAESIAFMARVIIEAGVDILAIQEVSAGKNFGARAVAALADELSKYGETWNYLISDPTEPSSPGVERYALLSMKSRFDMSRKDARLVNDLKVLVEREPYLVQVKPKESESFTVMTVHLVPQNKNPTAELMAIADSWEVRSVRRGIFAGDFNLPPRESDGLFAKLGFIGRVYHKTSVRRDYATHRGYLFAQYDNVYTKDMQVCASGVIDFVGKYFSPFDSQTLTEARKVSDHLPVFIWFR